MNNIVNYKLEDLSNGDDCENIMLHDYKSTLFDLHFYEGSWYFFGNQNKTSLMDVCDYIMLLNDKIVLRIDYISQFEPESKYYDIFNSIMELNDNEICLNDLISQLDEVEHIQLNNDGSGCIYEYEVSFVIFNFKNLNELETYLKNR